MTLQVTDREFDTILAALRCWQRTGNMACPEWAIANEHGPALEFNGIDRLCERLNTAEAPAGWGSVETAVE